MIKIFIIWGNISLNIYLIFSYATTTSTFSGSTSGPVYDENYPPPKPEKDTVINVEDSILTTLR